LTSIARRITTRTPMRFGEPPYLHLRIFSACINSVSADKHYAPVLSPTRGLTHARVWRECVRQEHGVDHRRGRAISLSMGALQDLSARSLVGELCSGRTIAHGAITQPAQIGRASCRE